MPNYYFTYWIASHGKDAFKNLADKICQNIKIPTPIIKALGKDEFLIEYCSFKLFWIKYKPNIFYVRFIANAWYK